MFIMGMVLLFTLGAICTILNFMLNIYIHLIAKRNKKSLLDDEGVVHELTAEDIKEMHTYEAMFQKMRREGW